ncbi:glycosyl hydrolase family 5 [uncultured Fibrobacter sp.]|uniref:glycosyl hydrolase family 5 n=1 Tax=uncultured Fibrobacter sp. TaxID=261512 RepID=UPI0025DACD0C|nr:glycosyl hydrolase family 5 [uncultured Fibrobacter sp.]
MKKLLLSSLLAAGAFSMFSACSDDPVTASSPIAAPTSSDSGYPGTSSSSSAFAPIPGYSSAIVPGSSGSNPLSSSSVVAPVPGSSSSVVNPSQSSSSVNPTSSATPGSSAVESSSSNGPVKTVGNPEEDIKLYPVPTLKNILGNGTSGWNTRYWDACKAHCSQTSTDGAEGKPKINTQEEYAASHYTARVCNINDIEIPTFTYSKGLERYWIGIQNTPNACQEADPASGGGFTCTDMAPVAVNDTLAYAFVAGSDATTSCGKCFHLQYDGSFKDADGNNAPKGTHKALKGKHIIVMASNIGHDVKPGQFDLMVPGGGPGIFNALQLQITKPGIEWGATYGGFLTYCQNGEKCGYDGTLECYQSCVKDMCDAAFGDSKYPNLLRGCHWFADWFMAADNPTYQWEEVECPQYLIDKYSTTISTSIETKILFQSDWSKYKGGEFITTDACSSTPNDQHEYCDPDQLAADKAKTY